MHFIKNNQKGFAAFLITLLIMAVLFGTAVSVYVLAYGQQMILKNMLLSSKAYYFSEAGLEDAIYRIKNGMPISSSYNLAVGSGSDAVTVSGDDAKTIVSLAEIKDTRRKVQAVLSLETINPKFFFGVQVGDGGVVMENNTNIEGNMYSDGKVLGGSTASVISGDTTVAAGNEIKNVTVFGTARANEIEGSNICGDAYYQTIDNSSLNFLNSPNSATCPLPLTPGTAHPGSPDEPTVPMPITQDDIGNWEAAAEDGAVYSAGSPQCTPTASMVLGPAKLNCDWNVSGNGIVITIKGPIWVNGDINLSNQVALVLDHSFGDTLSAVVTADAKEPALQNTKGKITTTPSIRICGTEGYNAGTKDCNTRSAENKSYIMMLSTYSNLSDDAISIKNNVKGAIFYATDGSISILNKAHVIEVTAYKLRITNNATVTYETGLYNAKFSSGPGASWQVTGWKEIE